LYPPFRFHVSHCGGEETKKEKMMSTVTSDLRESAASQTLNEQEARPGVPPLAEGTAGAAASEVQQALQVIRRQQPSRHLVYEEAEEYVDERLPGEDDYTRLEKHLWECEFCRGIIADLLQLSEGERERPRQFLDRVERYQRLSAAAAAAGATVRARLQRHGGRLVYEQDGVLVEELPDGSVRPLDDAALPGHEPAEPVSA
jgi:hypothetical protein